MFFVVQGEPSGNLVKMVAGPNRIHIGSVVHEEFDRDVIRLSLHGMGTSQLVDRLLGAMGNPQRYLPYLLMRKIKTS